VTHVTGKITAHPEASTLHARGTRGVPQMTTPAISAEEASRENQNLRHNYTGVNDRVTMPDLFMIFGISLKKLDLSTSFTVADHVML